MSELIITKEKALEIKAAIEAMTEDLKEYGVHVKAKGMYWNENSFWLNIQGQTDPEKPFDGKAKRQFLT